MKKGLTSLADDLDDTVKGINDFIKSLGKAQKDLKEITVGEEVQTVSTSSKKIVPTSTGEAKTAAASTLFTLLSGSGGAPVATTPGAPPMSAAPAPPAPPSGGGPPSAPPKAGPPSAPPTGPPKAGGPPKRPNLPAAPKLPPTGGGPPAAPPSGGGPPKAPTFAKRPVAPGAPPGGGPPSAGPPKSPGAPAAPSAAPQAGGGLSSLRDEMLDELNRLKKIMRGE